MPAHSTQEPRCKWCRATLAHDEGWIDRICDECRRQDEDERREREAEYADDEGEKGDEQDQTRKAEASAHIPVHDVREEA